MHHPNEKELGYPRLCAHRGYNFAAPENTLPAFGAAIALGAEEIELDVRFSSDGVPVICHDDRLERVSDGSGLVQDKTFAELKALDFGSRFGERFKGLREGFVGKATLDVAAEGGEEVFVLAVVVDAMFGIEDEIEAHGGGIGREAFGPTEGERVGILDRAEEEGVGGGPVGVIRFGVGLVKPATLRAAIPPPNKEREEGDGGDTDEIVKQIGHG